MTLIVVAGADAAYDHGGADTDSAEFLTVYADKAGTKLDGEGPFRVVPPQKVPGPPDQSSNYEGNDDIIWPFDASADHNAGYATRSATMIRVDPLPDGTTDIDTLEAGWNYVDEGKIVVYGAVDPLPNIPEKLDTLRVLLKAEDDASFKHRIFKQIIIFKLRIIEWMIHKGAYDAALSSIERGLPAKTDGCINNDAPDRNDWITDCELQAKTYWAIHEMNVLLTPQLDIPYSIFCGSTHSR